MSKGRISLQELVDLMVENRSITKKSADEFIRVLLSTIEDALANGEQVKVKGLGTFKSQWNEPRRSVDVNTGEEILIEGYYRAVFIPEAGLKDAVNEPFAHLEPVELESLEERTEDANKPDVDDDVELPRAIDTEEPLRVFGEQAEEIKELLSEINSLSTKKPKEKSIEKEEITEEVVSVEPVEEQAEDDAVAAEEESLKEETEQTEVKEIESIETEVKEIAYVKEDDDFNIVRDLSLLLATDEPKQDKEETLIDETAEVMEYDEEDEIDMDDELEDEVDENEEDFEEDDDDEVIATQTDKLKTELPEEETQTESTDDVPETSESELKEETIKEETKEKTKPQFETIKDDKDEKKSKLPRILLYLLILIALAAIAWFVINLRRYSEIKNSQKRRVESIADSTANELKVKQIADSLARAKSAYVVDSEQAVIDTVKQEKIDVEKKSNAAKAPSGSVFKANRTYNNFITTEKMTVGSQLTKFARDYYGNPVFWVYIYEANKSKISDPNNVPAGIDIKIPKLDPRLIDTKSKECLEYAKKLQTEYLTQ